MIKQTICSLFTLPLVLSVTGCFPLAHYKSFPESKDNYVGVWATKKDLLSTKTRDNYILLAIGEHQETLYINKKTGYCSYGDIARPIIKNRSIKIPYILIFDKKHTINKKPYQKSGQWKMVLDETTFYKIKEKKSEFRKIGQKLNSTCVGNESDDNNNNMEKNKLDEHDDDDDEMKKRKKRKRKRKRRSYSG